MKHEVAAFTMSTLLAVAAMLCLAEACSSQQTKAAAAEAAFTTELLRCVDMAKTLEESKACRREVNRKWGVAETLRDGGE